MTLPVLIVGSGALASFFAARLAATDASVTMLGGWPEGVAALQTRGVCLVDANGGERCFPVRVTADPSSCRPASHALVLVKSWQTARAAEQLAACLAADGIALTLQNGWGNRETLQAQLGMARVAAGVTTLGATLLGPGRVRAGGDGPVALPPDERLTPLRDLLRLAGFETRASADVDGLLWSKVVINAAINPLTALLRVPNGELLTHPDARALMAEAALEAAAAGRVQGFTLTFDDPVLAAEDVARRTAANHSSMFQDMLRGAPTEIDAICGAVVEAGEQTGVLTPVNRTLWRLVRAAVNGDRLSVISNQTGTDTYHESRNMKTVTTLDELWAERANLAGPVGLVPTMGFLHEGHLSLVRRAREECASVVVSIFVNPTQFGPSEDLATYPRDMDRDLALLEAAGVDLVWVPDVEVMYPPGFQTYVEVEGVSTGLEGERRPGHFRGVATVVAKLFAAVQPQRAYFGQKDAQQTVVIRQMGRDLSFPVDVVICPTVREPDGLAMSSRNAYLHGDERAAATVLYQALTAARAAFETGSRDAETLRQIMAATIDAEPLARRQYVSCADPLTLHELEGPVDSALLSMAVFVGRTRLIDNLMLDNA